MTTNNADPTPDDKKIIEARERIEFLAHGLVRMFDTVRAAGLLLGAAVSIMEFHGGVAFAVRYLRHLADDLERSKPGAAPKN